MSWDEYHTWRSYVDKRGTLNVGLRLEYLMARLALQINRVMGGDVEMSDVLRFHESGEGSIEDVAKMFGGLKASSDA